MASRPLSLTIYLRIEDRATRVIEEVNRSLNSLQDHLDQVAAAAEVATAACNQLADALTKLARRRVRPTIDLNIGPALAKLTELEAALNREFELKVGLQPGVATSIMEAINTEMLRWGRAGAVGVPMSGPESPASFFRAYDVLLNRWARTSGSSFQAGISSREAPTAVLEGLQRQNLFGTTPANGDPVSRIVDAIERVTTAQTEAINRSSDDQTGQIVNALSEIAGGRIVPENITLTRELARTLKAEMSAAESVSRGPAAAPPPQDSWTKLVHSMSGVAQDLDAKLSLSGDQFDKMVEVVVKGVNEPATILEETAKTLRVLLQSGKEVVIPRGNLHGPYSSPEDAQAAVFEAIDRLRTAPAQKGLAAFDLLATEPIVRSVEDTAAATQTALNKASIQLNSLAKQVKSLPANINQAPFWSQIADMQMKLNADPLTVDVKADLVPLLAQMQLMRGSLAGTVTQSMIAEAGGSSGGGGRISNFLGGLAGRTFGGGGGNGPPGIMSLLGFGGRKGWGRFLGPFAHYGSIGSLLGLGAEHAVFTSLGLVGSAAGAVLGGGLTALGAAGTAGVGMLTNAAGIGQAAGDIKNVVQAQSQLNQAIAVYGKNSRQAAAAQGQLNYTLHSFSPIARQAVLHTANLVQQFHKMFNALTGLAEKRGAQIIGQFVKVGERFLPTLGKFSAQNMTIMKQDLQPLQQWLTSSMPHGGLGIFTNLEKIFQSDLPTGIHAMTQAFEFFMKTVDVAAQHVGDFLKLFNNFITRANSASGFSHWSKTVVSLISLFRTWLHFLFTVGKTIFDIFLPAVGVGKQLITLFTGLLNIFDKWLHMAGTRNLLHQLFTVHMVELIKGFGGALRSLMPILLQVLDIYIRLAIVGTEVANVILGVVDALLRFTSHNALLRTITSWGLAFLFLRRSLLGIPFLLGTIMSKIPGLKMLGGGILKIFGVGGGSGPLGGAATALTGSAEELTGAAAALTDAAAVMVSGGAGTAAAAAGGVVGGETAAAAEGGIAAGILGDLKGALGLGALSGGQLGITALISAVAGVGLGNLIVTKVLHRRAVTLADAGAAAKEVYHYAVQVPLHYVGDVTTFFLPGAGSPSRESAAQRRTQEFIRWTNRVQANPARLLRQGQVFGANVPYPGAFASSTLGQVDLSMEKVNKALGLTTKKMFEFQAATALSMGMAALTTSKSASSMVNGLTKANEKLGIATQQTSKSIFSLAGDALKMEKKVPASIPLVNWLASHAPGELAVASKMTKKQLQNMTVQFKEFSLAGHLAKHGVNGFIHAIETGLAKGGPLTVKAVVGLIHHMGGPLALLKSLPKSDISGMIQGMVHGLTSGNPQVVQTVINMIKQMGNPMKLLPIIGRSNVIKLMQAMGSAITSRGGNVIRTLTNMVRRFKIPLSLLGSYGSEVGTSLMDGLIGSIQNKLPQAVRLGTGIARSIRQSFTGTQGFNSHSPSRVFIKIGEDVMKGLQLGIITGAKPIISTAEKIVKDIIHAFGAFSRFKKGIQSINELKTAFSDIFAILKELGKLPDALHDTFAHIQAIKKIGGELAAISPIIEHALVKMDQCFAKLRVGKGTMTGLNEVTRALSGLTSILSGLLQAQTDLAKLDFGKVFSQITNREFLHGIEIIASRLRSTFQKMGPMKKAEADAKQFAGVTGSLASIVLNLAKIQQSAPTLDFAKLVTDVKKLDSISHLSAPIQTLTKVISHMGDLNATRSRLAAVNGVFAQLAALFNNLASTAQNAQGQNILKELKVIDSAINQVAKGLNNHGLLNHFETLGENLIKALAAGMKLAEGEAARAAKGVANTIAAQFHPRHSGKGTQTNHATTSSGTNVTIENININHKSEVNSHTLTKDLMWALRPYLAGGKIK